MPLQNKVDPWGNLVAVKARGEYLGNRGILHDKEKNILKPWAHKKWVICELSFKGIKRRLFSDNKYSELFFLDEATALAAGHKPCAHCRRSRYSEFKELWRQANGLSEFESLSSEQMDSQLHKERVSSERTKKTFEASYGSLPDGTFIELNNGAHLVWENNIYRWSYQGYSRGEDSIAKNQLVKVITPKTIVRMYSSGFKPFVHKTIGDLQLG